MEILYTAYSIFENLLHSKGFRKYLVNQFNSQKKRSADSVDSEDYI